MSELVDTLHDQQQRRIDDMLTHYTDVQDTLEHGGMGSGTLGVGWLAMPEVWSRSGYPILEELLKVLRVGAADHLDIPLYSSVTTFYFRCRRVRRPLMRSHKGKPQQAVLNGIPQWRVQVEREGDRAKVRAALVRLAELWPKGARYQPETVEEIATRLERRKVAA